MATGFKSGGRKKGTPNLISGTVREMIKEPLTDELKSLPTLLIQLKPKDRIDSLIKLLLFIIPKVGETPEIQGNFMESHKSFVENRTAHINKKKSNQGAK